MKTKTALTLILALTLGCSVLYAQEPTPPSKAAGSSAPAPSAVAQQPKPSDGSAASPAEKPEPAPAAATVGLKAENPPSAPATTNDTESAETNASDHVDITLQPDVTLPNAVQLLARFANINFQFDPSLLAEKLPDGTPSMASVIGVEIRWKGVTAAQALEALLENNNWQMVSNSTGIYRITRKDPRSREPLVTRMVHVKYGSVTNLYTQLTNMFRSVYPSALLVPDQRTSQIVLVAPERDVVSIESTLKQLDTPSKQVLIEARLIETTRNPKSVKGINWSDTLEGQNFTFGNGKTVGTVNNTATTASGGTVTTGSGRVLGGGTTTTTSQRSDLLTSVGLGGITANTLSGFSPSTAFLNADGVRAVLSFINSDTESDQVAMPRTVAQDGVQTELAVIQNIPVFEQNQSPGQAGSQPMTTVRPVYDEKVGDNIINEIGVKLTVTPRIVGDTNVSLELRPEISDQAPELASFKLNDAENTSPIFNRRRMTTKAVVPSGYTLVLGGLNHDFSSKIYKKVPILGDIPGIGLAFRHENKSRTKQNLLIFVTPTIIEDEDYQLTKSEFLKTRFVDKPDVSESPWDTGKPKDWTKPKNEVQPVYTPTAR